MHGLYQRAEAALRQCAPQSPEQLAALSSVAAKGLLHELQVHHIELQMQHEELHRIHGELDASHARFVDLFDLAPVGYCTLTEAGLISEVNLTTTTLLNVVRSQMITQPIEHFIFKDDQDSYYLLKQRLRNAGGPQSCELRLLKRNGAPFWANLTISAVQDDADGFELRVVISDISERKQAEAAMIVSEQHHRTLIEWLPEPLIVHSEGITLYVNPAALKMFGATSASDMIGKPMLDLVHPDYRTVVLERAAINHQLGRHTPMLEQKLLKLDGTVMDVEVQGIQIFYDGKPSVQAVMHEISERKRAQASLQIAANVFIHAREGITVTDADGIIVDVNEAFTRITGYGREEVIGQNPRILQSGRQDKEFYVAMWRDLLARGYWSGEIWNKRKNGEIYPELLTVTAVTDAGGRVSQYLGLFSDIAVRRQMEDKVNQLAFYDPLTKLPNRRMLSDRLSQAMASSKRSGRYAAVMVLDLDNFKPLNDAHGHAAGDLLLEAVAGRMMGCVREVDTVARIGGDEFVVMLSELDLDRSESMAQAGLIAEKIRLALAAPYVLSLVKDGEEASALEHRCSASIGVVLFVNQEAGQAEILRSADAAMYLAKAAGRNAIRFHGADGLCF
jgi:diguanylate cyclase (GGDEF)-like protein/PAS domain S-box-containing protein